MSIWKEYELTKDELTRQIHQTLRDIYPEKDISADTVFDMISESTGRSKELIFRAADFAQLHEIDRAEFMTGLYVELGIEFEKNLHDKFYFIMTKDDSVLTFKMIEND